jgi:uncharacterized protein
VSAFLLDANVLLALTVAEHEHHERAATWLLAVPEFAVCPIVEGALVRFLLRLGESSRTASAILRAVRDHPKGVFWPDSISYLDLELSDTRGHRQVTDVYLAGLAASKGGRLATLDSDLVALRPEQTHLVPE